MASRKMLASLNPPGVPLTLKRHFFGGFLCAGKESYPPQAEALHFEAKPLDPCFRRMTSQGHWIPASARMTS